MNERSSPIADPKAFGDYLRDNGIMLRRTRSDVAREIPPLQKVFHQIDADPKALDQIEHSASELAKLILGKIAARSQTDVMRASSEFSNQLRQATGIAKAVHVANFVEMILTTGEPVALFGWHRAVYEIWEQKLKWFNPVWYTGTESPAAKDEAVRRFCAGDTNLIIMSLRSGAGVDGLQHRCATVVHGELDWSPAVMDQCNGRVARDMQTRPVCVYYLMAPDGCDPYMADVLGAKREQLEAIRDRDRNFIESMEIDPNHVKKLAEQYLGRKERP